MIKEVGADDRSLMASENSHNEQMEMIRRHARIIIDSFASDNYIPPCIPLHESVLDLYQSAVAEVARRTPQYHAMLEGVLLGDFGRRSLASALDYQGTRYLHINAARFVQLNQEERVMVITHELMHLYERHGELRGNMHDEDKALLSAATECVMNDWLLWRGYQMPTGITGRQVVGFSTHHNDSWEIYALLKDLISLAEVWRFAKRHQRLRRASGINTFLG